MVSSITTVKQDGFINRESVQQVRLKIFGIGSIGSILTKQAALTGFIDIEVFDFDTVEAENIGSQEYNMTHIGLKKTEALQSLLKQQYNFDIRVNDLKIDNDTTILPEDRTIYFCGVDSLEARKMIWDKLKRFPVFWCESRIGRDQQRYYMVDLTQRDEDWITEYEKSLDPTGPMTELSCGEKGTYSSNSELVGKIVRQLVNFAENKPTKQMYIGVWGGSGSIYREPLVEMSSEIVYN